MLIKVLSEWEVLSLSYLMGLLVPQEIHWIPKGVRWPEAAAFGLWVN